MEEILSLVKPPAFMMIGSGSMGRGATRWTQPCCPNATHRHLFCPSVLLPRASSRASLFPVGQHSFDKRWRLFSHLPRIQLCSKLSCRPVFVSRVSYHGTACPGTWYLVVLISQRSCVWPSMSITSAQAPLFTLHDASTLSHSIYELFVHPALGGTPLA